jgi:hypothetical protein
MHMSLDRKPLGAQVLGRLLEVLEPLADELLAQAPQLVGIEERLSGKRRVEVADEQLEGCTAATRQRDGLGQSGLRLGRGIEHREDAVEAFHGGASIRYP